MEKIITESELARVAELSKIEIEEARAQELIGDLENMIEFAQQISLADLSDKEKETIRLFSVSELREDTPAPSLQREKALAEAPTHTDSYITVPTVIEE